MGEGRIEFTARSRSDLPVQLGEFDLARHAGIWWVEEKLDGWRLLIAAPGRARLRNGTDVWAKLQGALRDEIERTLAGRPGCELDGELLAVDPCDRRVLPAAVVATALAGHGPALCYVPFALLGGPLDPQENWEILNASPLGAPATRGWMSLQTGADVERLLALARQLRIEGWVLKNQNSDWLKLKPLLTADLVVLDFIPGRGALAGKIGSLIVGARAPDGTPVEVARVNGLDNATRDALTPADLGRVCEVAYQGFTDAGRLRFPRWKRWRADKSVTNCTTLAQL